MTELKRTEENDWIVLEYGASRVYIAPVFVAVMGHLQRPDKTMADVIEQAIKKVTDPS